MDFKDATGYPIRPGQRAYVPARPSRALPHLWDPEKRTGGLPAIAGVVKAVHAHPRHVAVVELRDFDSHGTMHVSAAEVRIQPDRLGTMAACRYFMRYAATRAEQHEVEGRLADHLKHSKQDLGA